jgi:hypothetical protein
MHFLFLSNFPINEPSTRSPAGSVRRQLPVYKVFFFYISLNSSLKIFLNKETFPSLKNPKKEASHHVPQKARPLWKQTPISRALFSISFRVPSKGALRSASSHRAPLERDALLLQPSFIHLPKSAVYDPPPFQVPQRSPCWERCPSARAFIYTTTRVPSKWTPFTKYDLERVLLNS